MLFRSSFHRRIVAGDITFTFRRWRTPRVLAGGRYRFDAAAVLEVESIDTVAVRAITRADAVRAGYADRDVLLAELARSGDLRGGDPVFRITFRYVRQPDERAALASDARLSEKDAAALAARLRRMDRASRHGPWTLDTLSLIERNPHVAASLLARERGRETQAFKAGVRKLKELGLTRSFDIGYEVSPRGRALLRYLRRARHPRD